MHMNKSVLLVEGEGSQCHHHQAFEVSPKKSLKRIMEDGGSITMAVCQVKSSHIFLSRLFEDAPSNSRPDYSVNHAEIWSKLGNAFDFVLIDSPSLTSSDNTLEHAPLSMVFSSSSKPKRPVLKCT